MEIKTRNAKNKDVKELAELSRQSKKEFSGWEILIAENNEKILEYLYYKYIKEDRKLWLETIYIIKEFRNRGIAKKLIKRFPNPSLSTQQADWVLRSDSKRKSLIIKLERGKLRGIEPNLTIKKIIKNHDRKNPNIVLLTSDRNVRVFEKLGFEKTMNYMEFVRGKK